MDEQGTGDIEAEVRPSSGHQGSADHERVHAGGNPSPPPRTSTLTRGAIPGRMKTGGRVWRTPTTPLARSSPTAGWRVAPWQVAAASRLQTAWQARSSRIGAALGARWRTLVGGRQTAWLSCPNLARPARFSFCAIESTLARSRKVAVRRRANSGPGRRPRSGRRPARRRRLPRPGPSRT